MTESATAPATRRRGANTWPAPDMTPTLKVGMRTRWPHGQAPLDSGVWIVTHVTFTSAYLEKQDAPGQTYYLAPTSTGFITAGQDRERHPMALTDKHQAELMAFGADLLKERKDRVLTAIRENADTVPAQTALELLAVGIEHVVYEILHPESAAVLIAEGSGLFPVKKRAVLAPAGLRALTSGARAGEVAVMIADGFHDAAFDILPASVFAEKAPKPEPEVVAATPTLAPVPNPLKGEAQAKGKPAGKGKAAPIAVTPEPIFVEKMGRAATVVTGPSGHFLIKENGRRITRFGRMDEGQGAPFVLDEGTLTIERRPIKAEYFDLLFDAWRTGKDTTLFALEPQTLSGPINGPKVPPPAPPKGGKPVATKPAAPVKATAKATKPEPAKPATPADKLAAARAAAKAQKASTKAVLTAVKRAVKSATAKRRTVAAVTARRPAVKRSAPKGRKK